MSPSARIRVARETYREALLAARTDPTSRRWARLVRAWKNLKDALSGAGVDVAAETRDRLLGRAEPRER